MYFKIEVPFLLALMISWVSCQDCGNVKLDADWGEFTSPNYPNKYDHKVDCSWTITAPADHYVQLSFKAFDVTNPFWTCSDDYVKVVYDAKRYATFCNHHKAPDVIKSTTNTLTVHLHSDRFFSNGNGFLAQYFIVDKFGNKLAREEDEDAEDKWDDDSTTLATTTTTSTSAPTTTSTTTSMTTKTTKKTTKLSKSTSTLISRLTSSVSTETTTTMSSTSAGGDGSDDGLSNDPGAISGVLIGGIIGAVLIVFTIILFVAYVRYVRNKNKRINLNVIDVADGKELISDDKVYKKQGKKIVRVPEAEQFPL